MSKPEPMKILKANVPNESKPNKNKQESKFIANQKLATPADAKSRKITTSNWQELPNFMEPPRSDKPHDEPKDFFSLNVSQEEIIILLVILILAIEDKLDFLTLACLLILLFDFDLNFENRT